MSTASEYDRPAAEARGPERNGAPSLSDRVRSLRLSDRPAAPSGPGNALPWFLCAVLLLTTAAIGYRSYRLKPAVEPSPTAAPDGAAATAPAAARSKGDVELESKGNAIPAHQIQVSPNKVSGRITF